MIISSLSKKLGKLSYSRLDKINEEERNKNKKRLFELLEENIDDMWW